MRVALALACLLAAACLPAPPAAAQERPRATGTGFLVAGTMALTNNHVIAGCRRVSVRTAARAVDGARVVAADPRRDLALLEVPPGIGPALAFRDGPPLALGEPVVTYGFPLSGMLSSGPTLTTGDVSALSGLRDDPATLQISAPVQPGNSGGPLLDGHGLVIGIVASKLNALRVAQMTGGDIPQNVNFAIKADTALPFLRGAGVQPRLAPASGPDRKPAEIGAEVGASVLFVQCFGGAAPPAPAGAGTAMAPKPPGDPSVRLVNRAPQPIVEFFATPSTRGNWGQNRMQGHTLAQGQAHLFRLPPQEGCVWDLRVVFADRRALERKGADLCRIRDLPVP